MLDGVKAAFGEIRASLVRRSGDDLVRLRRPARRRAPAAGPAGGGRARRVRGADRRGAGQLERMQGLIRELERDRGPSSASWRPARRRRQERRGAGRADPDAGAGARQRADARPVGRAAGRGRLAACGLVEGVNYRRQAATVGGGRPDFTFLLPHGQRLLHMDVKFPFENYLRGRRPRRARRAAAEAAFVRDVRGRIGEVGEGAYVAPERARSISRCCSSPTSR